MAHNTPVLILGMHRSGTSCLAGSLQDAGLYLGEVNTKAGFNKKGNREHQTAMALHETILQRDGSAWNTPPAHDPIWTHTEKQELRDIIKSFSGRPNWGLKDPRALFMMDGWLTLTRPRFIGTFRHPNEVAASLMHRAKTWNQPMSKAAAFHLWEVYNARMLAFYAAQKFDIIRYDIPADIYHKKLRVAGENIGLNVAQAPSFREAGLHNQQRQGAPITRTLKPVWEALNDLAL